MLKKFLIFIYIILVAFVNNCVAQASTKITNVSFDNSDSIIFLSATNQAEEEVVAQKIKIVKLDDPKRIYFDLPNTILTFKNKSWIMQNSKLKEVKVAQTATNPDIVRVVITSDVDLSKIYVMQVPSGYIIKYGENVASNDFLSEFYRDTTTSTNDYYEKASSVDAESVNAEKNLIKNVDANMEKINSALTNTSTATTNQNNNVIPIPAQNLSVSSNVSKIKTKYYLNRVDIKRGNILVSGIGSASLEKVKILTEPNRLVYDMPNAVLNPNLRNNEYKIDETESVRLGQFEQSKVRIVITTKDTSKYKPIFSQDMQGILFAHDDKLTNIKLFDKITTLNSYTVKHSTEYDLLTMNLSEPVIQSVVRDYDKINLTIYNAKPIANEFFSNNIKSTLFKNLKISKIDSTDRFQAGQMITIPVNKYDTVFIYEAQHGKQIVIKIEPQKVIQTKPTKTEKPKTINKNKVIIIDPGHGGADVGATRENVFEKDLNLDVSKKVYNLLTKSGYKVEMTRTNDTNPTLQERCDFSNERNAVVFVSIHTNASVNEAPNGIETHYYHDNSVDFANIIQNHLIKETKSANRGTIKSMFYVINHTNVPAILVEMGYISNEKERATLQTENRKNQTAKAISDGIIEYLKGQK